MFDDELVVPPLASEHSTSSKEPLEYLKRVKKKIRRKLKKSNSTTAPISVGKLMEKVVVTNKKYSSKNEVNSITSLLIPSAEMDKTLNSSHASSQSSLPSYDHSSMQSHCIISDFRLDDNNSIHSMLTASTSFASIASKKTNKEMVLATNLLL